MLGPLADFLLFFMTFKSSLSSTYLLKNQAFTAKKLELPKCSKISIIFWKKLLGDEMYVENTYAANKNNFQRESTGIASQQGW